MHHALRSRLITFAAGVTNRGVCTAEVAQTPTPDAAKSLTTRHRMLGTSSRLRAKVGETQA